MIIGPGARIGPYQVAALIGEGGMGQVYRATDTSLKRTVAIKVLPETVATDPERLARFQREAEVLARLNHPNIAQIHGLEKSDGTPALVMEFVEGPTLAERLASGAMPMDEALPVARQIADALEAAHEQGIIHRDLKPANVKVRADGTVKVLDFGLAKALAPEGASATADVTNSPTLTSPVGATGLGVLIGTAAYMAPEQARGKVVDKRADIWSFGVVLYEMLTGRRLFRGGHVTDTLAEVLKTDPDWRALPASTPLPIRRLLQRCLVRDPNARLHDIADARLEIEAALAPPDDGVTEGATRVGRRERRLWLAAMAGAAAVAAAAVWYLRPAAIASAPESRLQIVTPSSGSFAVAPDGRKVAYIATTPDGKTQMWLRQFDAEQPHLLPGTEGNHAIGATAAAIGSTIAWSPDSRSILFVEGGTLKEVPVDVDGGAAHALPAQAPGFGFTRNADGLLLFAPANCAPIQRVPMNGGTPEAATRLVKPQVGHRFPYFLPDGRHFLFLATGPPGVQGIYLGVLGSLDAQRLVDADTFAVFSPPDLVVFGRQDALFAQRLNPRTFAIEGTPFPVADSVQQVRSAFGHASLSASWTGPLVYRPALNPRRQLMWLNRSGTPVGVVGGEDMAEADSPLRLSSDGRVIALTRRVNSNTNLWTIPNTEGGVLQPLTSDPALDGGGVWSRDARQLAFHSARKGGGFNTIYYKAVGGTGDEVELPQSPDKNNAIHDWSRDGHFVLFGVQGCQERPRDLWAIPMDGDRQPFQVTKTRSVDERAARFSADAKWIAYESNADSATVDVYVRQFRGSEREWRISKGGGTQPNWSGDGTELYYLAPNNRLMAVPITLPRDGDAFQRGAPHFLFTAPGIATYAPAADGHEKFLVNVILEEAPPPPLTVILNWRRK